MHKQAGQRFVVLYLFFWKIESDPSAVLFIKNYQLDEFKTEIKHFRSSTPTSFFIKVGLIILFYRPAIRWMRSTEYRDIKTEILEQTLETLSVSRLLGVLRFLSLHPQPRQNNKQSHSCCLLLEKQPGLISLRGNAHTDSI